jgi:hypothetical protein
MNEQHSITVDFEIREGKKTTTYTCDTCGAWFSDITVADKHSKLDHSDLVVKRTENNLMTQPINQVVGSGYTYREQREILINDLKGKLFREDFHGVRDACVDIEVLDAKEGK